MRLRSLVIVTLILGFTSFNAQNKSTSVKKTVSRYPASFVITKAEFDKLFTLKNNEVVNVPANKYLDKSVLELNTLNGDMRLLRIKLNYFPKALLMVLVNGEYSTQVYITSSDKLLSYKGKLEKDKVTLTKCNRDEIVSE